MMNILRTWVYRLLSLRRRWLGVVVACVVWLVWMVFGFWSLVLLAILVAIGYGVGVATERGITWREIVRHLLSNRDSK